MEEWFVATCHITVQAAAHVFRSLAYPKPFINIARNLCREKYVYSSE